ncbi:MAG: formylglycine-generating enzyme family protein [Candidatus Cloacimonetes bacterium]|jgi:formylglycine-generating enzyme required for sulfatase activity|nr:formylglycine-generating enzyme family protein [Candidatus Cloacimonadota bacterium]
MRRNIVALLLIFCSFYLFAETILQQSFEAAATDTWSYTANPSPDSKRVWWGPTTEAMGGATAQEGTMYWAGWDLDNVESTVTFDTQTLSAYYSYQLSFWYYTRNLASTNDYCRYSLMYDTGSNWDNWVTVNNNSNAWTQVTVDIPTGVSNLRFRLSSKFDGSTKYAHWDYITVGKTPNPSTAPVVSNVSAVQRTDGSKLMDIYYDVFDANGDLCDITLKVSDNDGDSFDIIPSLANLSGDFGDDLSLGTDKHIVWAAGAESYTLEGDSYLYRVYADDGSTPAVPENFVLVEGGNFHNGTSNVTVSSFYLDKYELTQADYQAVMGMNPSYFSGNPNHPVEMVSWFNAIEYSNRRSIQESLTPCYSYDTYGTNPDNWPSGWNTSFSNHINVSCNWSANGYRLPTEAEWQFAAKGGNQTHNYTYSGSNTIGSVAWYYDNSYNMGSGHPDYGTHTVGIKLPNELGLYDMSGNVYEWNWDIYGSYPSGSQNNPTGPNSGSNRVLRGGGWNDYDGNCTVSFRNYYVDATSSDTGLGFRLLRVSP